MKWSFRIGRIAGIPLYIHATFLILVAWVAIMEYASHANPAATADSIALIALVFVIVVLHELGHALAARRYGIETQDITLLPIGGLARLRRIPEDPRQELVVAFAGPLVNVVLAASLFLGICIAAGPREVLRGALTGGDLMAQLVWVNVLLAVFNLIPAFPMDGGRVFRALLAFHMDRVRATEIAVSVGHLCAFVFGAIGLLLLFNPFLVFIAFFVWIGADAELQHVRMHATLSGVKVGDVMTRRFESVEASSHLS
ncbi:MAG TPA: site-2 protease family protein, partial [Fimbriimonadaceae bacterium]|nr:site-2 protease family protein [Fimbriimonadaceae bacterium]